MDGARTCVRLATWRVAMVGLSLAAGARTCDVVGAPPALASGGAEGMAEGNAMGGADGMEATDAVGTFEFRFAVAFSADPPPRPALAAALRLGRKAGMATLMPALASMVCFLTPDTEPWAGLATGMWLIWFKADHAASMNSK